MAYDENMIISGKQSLLILSQQIVYKLTEMSDSSNSEIKDVDLRDAEILIRNKNVTSLWLLLITQLFYCFMYGFFMRVSSVSITSSEEFVHTALLLLLIIGGFGLAFAYPARMVWTSLGFNLLITALSIQTFFLVNAFWIKAKVFLGTSQFSIDTYNIALSPGETGSPTTGANLNQAIKASLSCIVAFSFIRGRAGLLEAYFITVLGTIIYQLARQTCLNNFAYEVGSIKIFVFGGILGWIASVVVSRLGDEANILNHHLLYENKKSVILNLVGVVICWALFPLLARDASLNQVVHTQQTRVFSIVLAMSSAALLSIFISGFKYGFRLVINSVIGAGVAILSSSAYISNPVYGIVFGLSSAIAQFIFHLIYKELSIKTDPNLFVFVGQGILGIFFETINRSAVENNPNSLQFVWTNNKRPEHILGNGAITAGMALLLGFVLGSLFSCCSYHEEIDHYHDFTYWVEGDGLNSHDQISVKKIDEQQVQDEKQVYAHPDFRHKNANL